MKHLPSKTLALLLAACLATSLFAQAPQGEVMGSATAHTAESAKGVITGASVALPASLTGGAPYFGAFANIPATTGLAPVVVFLHGSSGIKLAAISEWQRWLASQGIASIAPDSFALPNRLSYKSPVGKAIYEKVHQLRASEIGLALNALKGTTWADPRQLVLAGTSEGSVSVARHSGEGFIAKMMFAWSCEDNYFVESHQTSGNHNIPILNIISNNDPFFSPSNTWLGNPNAKGHCAAALKDNKRASVVLLPDAPHTLFHFTAARHAISGFLKEVLGR